MFGFIGLVAGVILMVIGAFMVFIFPVAVQYQTEGFSSTGIGAGVACLVAGGLLIFL